MRTSIMTLCLGLVGCAAATPETADDDDVVESPKADWWYCTANPWAWGCGGGAPSPSTATVEVSVGVCLVDDAFCLEYSSAPCARTSLQTAEGEVAAGLTNGNGRITFEGVDPGDYVLRVSDRQGELLLEQPVEIAEGTDPRWVYAYLPVGSRERVRACADVKGTLSVNGCDGDALSPSEARRWDWVLRLTEADADEPRVVHAGAPYYGTTGRNEWTMRNVPAGAWSLDVIRVELPERFNLDYEDELRWRRHEVAAAFDVEIADADLGEAVELDVTGVDDPFCD